MTRKHWIISAALVLALAAASSGAWYLSHADDDIIQPAAAATSPGYTVTPHDMTLGNPKAKAVMIEYAAPICPHCAHFNATVMPLLKKNYIGPGKLFYVFRVFPLQAADGAAEKLARCMPKERYFPFMDQLFANQKDWDPEYGVTGVRGALVKQVAKQGMSEAQFNACLKDPKPDAMINKVAQEGIDRYHLDHTPTVVLNGTVQADATWDSLKPAIDKALAK
jgi:protein-disulfide isomerase